MIALMFMGFGLVALMQIPSLVQKQWWRELTAFIILWLSGLIFSLMLALGVKLPPVTTIIGQFLSDIFGI
jgi:hypothetical protein